MSTQSVDVAMGILIGLRRCGMAAAFDELVAAAHRYHVPVVTMATALIAVASGETSAYTPNSAAQHAAEREWRKLLVQAAPRAAPWMCPTSTTARNP